MKQELVVTPPVPQVPKNWNYETSVKQVRQFVYKWKNMETTVASELYIAREMLSTPAWNKGGGTKVPSWSEYCKEIGSSKQVVNRWLSRWYPLVGQKTHNDKSPPQLPKGEFDIVYADPPWQYEHPISDSRRIENQYDTMDLEKIKGLGTEIPFAKDSILFMWTTASIIKQALEVMDSWGLTFRTTAIWDKEVIGMGYWFRTQHEILLVGIKGDFHPAEPVNRASSIYREKRGKHSKKPTYYYELIENMYPRDKYLELFARTTRPKWIGWGLEYGKV